MSGHIWAIAIGVAFGMIVQRSHFCTMGCVSDAVLFGSFRRGRVWALAAATALIGSQALDLAGLVDLGASAYRAQPASWPGSIAGGLLFGFGMVLAGGCLSRNLVRLASGSLKALTALLVAMATALPTLALLPGPPPVADASSGRPAEILGIALGVGLLTFALWNRQMRRAPGELLTGLALGALVPLAWLAAVSPAALNFVAPTLEGQRGAGLALIAGTLIGAAGMAAAQGRLRLERFAGRDDLRRHLAGGALMGAGGALAAGCTVGHGMSGIAAAGLASWLALAAMLVGAWWGVKHLETGRLFPFLPSAVGTVG